MNDQPILGITMGDPAGVGPEIIAKAWAKTRSTEGSRLLVIGDATTMQRAFTTIGQQGAVRAVRRVQEARFETDSLDVLQAVENDLNAITMGRVQPQAGEAAYQALAQAIALAQAKEIAGIVTAPLNKAALNLAGHHYAGHTEILADLTGTKRVTMMLIAGSFRVSHVSTHCSLREAIERVRQERILEVLRLTHQALIRLGNSRAYIGVAGLNPHAGEGGLFGDEELREIMPAIDLARAAGLNVHPQPLPPDTIFQRMATRREFDAVVAMYHDQGHIPTKVLAFSQGVNVTLGLPIVRTSVDHGTAFDIAGTGAADPESLLCAIETAIALVQGR